MTDVVYLHLQRGFADDTVTVAVNDTPQVRRENVTTSPLTALASTIEIGVPEGGGTLEVEVPTKHLRQEVALDGGGVLVANIIDGRLALYRPEHRVEYE